MANKMVSIGTHKDEAITIKKWSMILNEESSLILSVTKSANSSFSPYSSVTIQGYGNNVYIDQEDIPTLIEGLKQASAIIDKELK